MSTETQQTPAPPAERRRRWGRWLLWSVLLVGLLAGVAVMFVRLAADEAASPPPEVAPRDPEAGPEPAPPAEPAPPDPEADPGPAARAPLGVRLSASSHDGNDPFRVLDGYSSTRWSAEGDGEWVGFDFGAVQRFESVEIAWYQGDARAAAFAIEVSRDGDRWTTVHEGHSSGTTAEYERYEVDATGRHLRVVGHGNDQNDWTSITGVRVNDRDLVVTQPADAAVLSYSPPSGADLAVHADFDDLVTGPLTPETLERAFETDGSDAFVPYADHKELDGMAIVENPLGDGRVLEVTLPPDTLGGVMNFPVNLVADGPGFDEAWLSYRVMFSPGFDFEPSGGKLPGLAGGPDAGNLNQEFPAGCDDVTGDNGFSARLMWVSWREETDGAAALSQYLYHMNKTAGCGDVILYDQGSAGFTELEAGRWYDIRNRVVINDPGERNGIVEAWLDGERVLRMTDVEFRDEDSWAVNVLYMAGFFGGSSDDYRHDHTEKMFYDDFVVHGVNR